MSTYKVPQDIEAEDKLLGPLTLKQFIFAIMFFLTGYLAFTFMQANLLLGVPFILPMALLGYLAAPFQRDQPTDVYLGARLRFLFKPRKRIWDQAGMSELVKITVPKKMEVQLTKGLDESQVSSRLEILASTIDSRGWATKNVFINEPAFASPAADSSSDRLVAVEEVPQTVPTIGTDIVAADDVMDPIANPIAQHMQQLAQQSTSAIKQRATAQISDPDVVNATIDEGSAEAILQRAHQAHPYPDQMRQHIVTPIEERASAERSKERASERPKPTEIATSHANMELSQRDDLNVDVIKRQADRVGRNSNDENEVIVNLH